MKRNRAKCKKCDDIIESFFVYDTVSCSCGEIAVSTGEGEGDAKYLSSANDFANFIRVDDMDKEVPVDYRENKEKDNKEAEPAEDNKDMAIDSLLDVLKNKIEIVSNLPTHIQQSFVTQMDLADALSVVYALFRQFYPKSPA